MLQLMGWQRSDTTEQQPRGADQGGLEKIDKQKLT